MPVIAAPSEPITPPPEVAPAADEVTEIKDDDGDATGAHADADADADATDPPADAATAPERTRRRSPPRSTKPTTNRRRDPEPAKASTRADASPSPKPVAKDEPATPSVTPAPVTPPPPAAPTGPRPGTMDPKSVRAVARAHLGEIETCVSRARMENRDLAGRVVLRIDVSPAGKVTGTSIAASTGADDNLQACMQRTVASWTFPPPAGGVRGAFTYPFTF